MEKTFKAIGILGSGQMGTGIAEVFLQNGYCVFLYDQTLTSLQKSQQKITAFFKKQAALNAVLNTKEIDRNTHFSQRLADLKGCDLVIEAATENFDLKAAVLKDVSTYLKEDALLVTNTSSLSLDQLSSHVKNPQLFMGMHFMNPVPVIPLVELIPSAQTNQETIKQIAHVVTTLGKTAVYSKDSPGFIVNRILIPMIHEAIAVLESGIASKEDIDKAMKLGTNHPIGPLALADLIGLDTCLAIMQTLEKNLQASKYAPCALLQTMVKQGLLGRKCGKGFYQY